MHIYCLVGLLFLFPVAPCLATTFAIVVTPTGIVIGADGKKMGKAKKNGDYYNNEGEVVLQLKNADAERCEILDPKGHSQGYVHRNYKLHACAAHCYWLEQAKLKKEKEEKEKAKTK